MPYNNHRMLYIFGAEANRPLVTQQLEVLKANAAAVKERNIELEVVDANDKLYESYKVDATKFTVLLVGKDGGEKYRTNKLLQPAELFAIIDARPMRKQEMKQQKNQ